MTSPNPYPSATTPVGDASVGELIGNVAADLSKLMRQELELAKAETKGELAKAGKGAGLLGGAGYAGVMLGIFASLTLVFLLDLAMPLWVAALLVTLLWGAAAAVLFSKGRAQMKTVNPTPTQTVNSLKETF
ncbi:MAG: phage holin family protein [Mycobacteriales bacterium]